MIEDEFIQSSEISQQRNFRLELKWRFFFFSCVFKNITRTGFAPNFVFLIIEIVVLIFTGYYAVISETMPNDISEKIFKSNQYIFPSSSFLSLLTPGIFSAIFLLTILCIFFIVFLVIFILCFVFPHWISFFKIIFYPQIHLIFYPFITGTFGYCLNYIISDHGSGITLAFCICNIILYFIYTYFISLLCFLESNSLINPNPLLTEYFSGYSIFYPMIISIISLICFHADKFNEVGKFVLLSILCILPLFVGIFICINQPFMVSTINEVFSAKFFTISAISIITIISMVLKENFHRWTITLILLIGIILLSIVHILNSIFRKSTEEILAQIGDPDSLTIESLETTFQSLFQERKFHNIIRVGILSGNKVILDEIFVRYCLEKYPSSEWLLKYVTFLYSTVWGCDSDTYQFLLHLCSCNMFSKTTEMLLFHSTFCYMQSSQELSPIIERELASYRTEFMYTCRAHKKFWLSNFDEKSIDSDKTIMFSLLYKIQTHLNRMRQCYRFCPSVHFECAIFEADFLHKYESSSVHFMNGTNLAKNPKKYISEKLFEPFSLIFPSIKKNYLQVHDGNEHSPDGFAFISLRDQNDRAKFYSSQLITYDPYIKKLCKPFFISKAQLQTKFPFFTSKIVFLKVALVFILSSYILCNYFHFRSNNIFFTGIDVHNSVREKINTTINFRKDVTTYAFNLMLLVDIFNRSYGDSTVFKNEGQISESNWNNFYNFALEHLEQTEIKILKFRHTYDLFNHSFPGETAQASNFTLHLSHAHVFYEFFSRTNATIEEIVDYVEPTLSVDIPAIITITDSIIFAMIDYISNYSSNILLDNQGVLIASITIEILTPIIGLLVIKESIRFIFMKVFSIIKTIQPPVLKYIANTFEKLLSTEEHQELENKFIKFSNPSLILCASFFINAIDTIMILCILIFRDKTVYCNRELPTLMQLTVPSRFVFYSQAWLEYRISDENSDISIGVNGTVVDEVFGEETLCINNAFDNMPDNFFLECPFFNYSPTFFKLTNFIFFVISLPLLLYFTYLLFIIEKVSHFGRYILYFLPSLAVNSNPVFQSLIRGYHLSIKDVNIFAEELQAIPKFKGAFCTFFYNEKDEITSVYGDRKMFMSIKPTHIQEVMEYLMKEQSHTSGSLEAFFESKGQVLRMTLKNEKDISISFIKPDQLFIKSEISNEEIIKKEKLIRYLTESVDKFYPRKRPPIQFGVVFVITCLEERDHFNLINLALEQNEFFIFDTRNNSLSGAFDLKAGNNQPTSQNASRTILESFLGCGLLGFLSFMSKIPKTCTAAIAVGGPMTFFDMPRGQFTKSRCVSECYDTAFLLTSLSAPGFVSLTKQFLDIIKCDQSKHSLKSLPLSNNEVIKYSFVKIHKMKKIFKTEVNNCRNNDPDKNPTNVNASST
ncbi:hypothetical protein TRFO_04397 [Tritrichomonas foetus]|uniref:Uncharacterized protein n=1 Tax=Tritrichomonas foetus TaxID=1144522 RepID=A0A1J4KEJ8_9EUKA|nr:hypothetical protein TRFO_04397 [Tritrichomonas foetus]|eukprot:OHT09865.1 hypothetical protein TRFO_04397 [Tritrichomonas foetus]